MPGPKPSRNYKQLKDIVRRQKQSGKNLRQFCRENLKLDTSGYMTLYTQLRRVSLLRVHTPKKVKVQTQKAKKIVKVTTRKPELVAA